MKFAAALRALLSASAVLALPQRAAPICARDCLRNAVREITDCDLDDRGCMCFRFNEIKAEAEPCINTRCGPDITFKKAVPAAIAYCVAGEDATPPGTGNDVNWRDEIDDGFY